jgi:sulfate/thiosulfate transport system ATP-binding protein
VSLLVYRISKLTQNNCILDRVSLHLPKGYLGALLGPSGSGKSSLLRVIAGLDLPSNGSVWLNGKNVTNIAPQYRNMGFVFQNFALFKHMNVRDNIGFGLTLRNVSKDLITNRVLYLLDALRISDIALQYPNQLSGGQKQRVALARSLAIQPEFLLLDEPFKALDNELRRYLSKWLTNFVKTKGITTIMVTHDQQEAVSMADEILVFKEGRLVQQGDPQNIYDWPINKFVGSFFGPQIEVPQNILYNNSSWQSKFVLNNPQSLWLSKLANLENDQSIMCIRPYEIHLQTKSSREDFVVKIQAIFYKINFIEMYLFMPFLSKVFKIQLGYPAFNKLNIKSLQQDLFLTFRTGLISKLQ